MTIFFLNPLFLTALVCVGVPLVLHLLKRPKPQKLTFPALRFLQKKEKTCRRSFQMRHWLLLAIRMLLTIMLVLLFARPGIHFVTNDSSVNASYPTEYSNKPTAVIFLVDTSTRMEYVFENRSRLTEAQEQAIQILTGLPSQSVAAVLSTSFTVPVFSPDKGEIQRQIRRLKTSPGTRTIPETLPEALELLKTSSLEQQEIFIFTDCTAQSWKFNGKAQRDGLERSFKEIQGRFPNLRVTLVDVGVKNAVNARLDVLNESSFQTVSGGSVEIQSRVLFSDGKPHRLGIFILDETGRPLLREEKNVSPHDFSLSNASSNSAANASIPIESSDGVREISIPVAFQLGSLKIGANQGFIALLDEDALAADNARGFTIEKAPPAPVLLVANAPSEQNAFLVRQALAPTQFTFENRAKFDCFTISYDQFSAWILGNRATSKPFAGSSTISSPTSETLTRRSGALEGFHAIFFLDPPGFSSLEWNRLGEYVTSGGGLAFFLGASLKEPQSFRLAEARRFLPGAPGIQARFPKGTTLNPRFSTVHPILRTFQNLETPIPWEDSPVFRAWTLEEPTDDALILFEWDDGSPALLSKTTGNGRVLLAGTPVNMLQNNSRTLWNLLPQGDSWVFPVLMNITAKYLSEECETSVNIFTNETISFPLRGTESERFFLSRRPFSAPDAQTAASPNSPTDAISLIPDVERRHLDVPALEQTGNYLLSDSPPRDLAASISDFQRGFSVNLPLELTDLKRLSHEEIQRLFHPFSVVFMKNVQRLERSISGTQSANDLFNWIACLILALFLLENWMANRFYRTS